MTIPEMFKKGGESYFRDLEHEIAKKVCSMSRAVVSTGGGMRTFARNGEILSKQGIVIYLEKDFEECYSRLALEKDRPLVKSRTKEELRKTRATPRRKSSTWPGKKPYPARSSTATPYR